MSQKAVETMLGISRPKIEKGVTVYSRDAKKKKGKTTGGGYRCQMSGCMGMRLGVKWEDGKMTFPCTKGMLRRKKSWRIL